MTLIHIQKLNQEAKTPGYAKPGDAGFDLHAIEDTLLMPNEKKLIKTGIALAIPEGFVGLIKDRSGLAAKHSIHTLAGVIDSGYRGEVCIVLINHGAQEFKISKHDRVAQMLIQPVHTATFKEVPSLPESQRGTGGFGSSGK